MINKYQQPLVLPFSRENLIVDSEGYSSDKYAQYLVDRYDYMEFIIKQFEQRITNLEGKP